MNTVFVSLCLLLSSGVQAQDDPFADVFQNTYVEQRLSVGFGSTDPETYYRVEHELIKGNSSLLNVRGFFSLASTAVDRYVGVILAVPNSPGKITTALSALATASEVRGLAEDLGISELGSSENFIYETNGYIGLLGGMHDTAKSASILKNISSFKDIHSLVQGGKTAADAKKLANIKMYGIAVADFILDKTLMAQVRAQLKMDKLKKYLLAHRYLMAVELERLWRKAKRGELGWYEAMTLMMTEGQYFARKAESYYIDEMYWQEQLNPTAGKIPLFKKTIMDFMPGYNDEDKERINLEFAQQQRQNSIWHRQMCDDFMNETLRNFALVEQGVAARDSAGTQRHMPEEKPSYSPNLGPVQITFPMSSQFEFSVMTNANAGEMKKLTLSVILHGVYPSLIEPHSLPDEWSRLTGRYSSGLIYAVGADQDVIRKNADNALLFGYNESTGRFVYIHLNKDVPERLWRTPERVYEQFGSDHVYIRVLNVMQINLDSDPEREFVFMIYGDESDLPTNGQALDRHSVLVADMVGMQSSGIPIFNTCKGAFYADNYELVHFSDRDGDGMQEVVVKYSVGSSPAEITFEFTGSKLVEVQ